MNGFRINSIEKDANVNDFNEPYLWRKTVFYHAFTRLTATVSHTYPARLPGRHGTDSIAGLKHCRYGLLIGVELTVRDASLILSL